MSALCPKIPWLGLVCGGARPSHAQRRRLTQLSVIGSIFDAICSLTTIWQPRKESNLLHSVLETGVRPASWLNLAGQEGFDHSVNIRTHNRCASDPEMQKPRRSKVQKIVLSSRLSDHLNRLR